jgi:hypothetical protein
MTPKNSREEDNPLFLLPLTDQMSVFIVGQAKPLHT